ncbi:malate dehydrogenase (quinone) [Nocardioides sp. YIM 152588]|uniref:malate dehydrogenase (quinone) n=1 Tax=Nocardioides sp. YIM 152588 TaxID=3158259 RepID=UPI0032E4BBA7
MTRPTDLTGTTIDPAASEAAPGEDAFTYDAVLVGGGVMSATLATLLRLVEPTWRIAIVERLDRLAAESSGPWNNAGTGHAALCELNYSPRLDDGTIDITKAVGVNEQFWLSRQLWAFLVESGHIPDPAAFIRATPHLSFVWGEENVAYLRDRYEALAAHPLFAGMEYTEDPAVIEEWAPLLVAGRDVAAGEPVAATRSMEGTDVDFGALTAAMLDHLTDTDAIDLLTGVEVRRLRRFTAGDEEGWRIRGKSRDAGGPLSVTARFVFVGAGGQALTLLQRSGIEEVRGFGGFPVSGVFWRTRTTEVVDQHQAKVYGKAAVGAPPMSVPHLDTRVVDGESSLMFGPYAGFSPRFLKHGSIFDLLKSVRLHNLIPMLVVGLRNLSLVRYLIAEVFASKKAQLSQLRDFYPAANADDWEKIVAGQRVQVIKPTGSGRFWRGGSLQFGTEVITSADGSIAGLLGASPGASTAVAAMLDVMERCFPEHLAEWRPALEKAMPSYGTLLTQNPELAAEVAATTARTLALEPASEATAE